MWKPLADPVGWQLAMYCYGHHVDIVYILYLSSKTVPTQNISWVVAQWQTQLKLVNCLNSFIGAESLSFPPNPKFSNRNNNLTMVGVHVCHTYKRWAHIYICSRDSANHPLTERKQKGCVCTQRSTHGSRGYQNDSSSHVCNSLDIIIGHLLEIGSSEIFDARPGYPTSTHTP